MNRGRIFDDLSRVAEGAATAFQGLREEAGTIARARVERLIAEFDLVTREEFDAVRELAANARAEADALKARLDALEARLGGAVPDGEPVADGTPSDGPSD